MLRVSWGALTVIGSTLALVVSVTTLTVSQVPDTSRQSQGDCVTFETPDRLASGTSFKTPIGNGLEFRLSAGAPGGWAISIGLWIVSPPLRTAPHRYIGGGESAPALSPRRFQFVTSKGEYERAEELVEVATRGQGIGVKHIEQAGRGTLQLWITDSGVNQADGSLEWIAVRGRACVPPEPSPKR